MTRSDEFLNTINNRDLPKISHTKQILVSIIVLNRNGINHLRTLVPALIRNTANIHYELIFVDNASNDDSVTYIKNNVKNIPLQIIQNDINESFSKANNKAVRNAKGKFIVLLNNDIEPLSGWLHHLLVCVESNQNIGCVGARLIYPPVNPPRFNNPFKRKNDLSCKVQHSGVGFYYEGKQFRPFNLGKGKSINDSSVLKSRNRSALTAACTLIPKKVYEEVGGLDETYNYGGEDVDFGLKLIQAGYSNYYCADSVLFHHEFGTQSKEKNKSGAERRRANLEYFQSKWYLHIKKAFWSEKILGKPNIYSDKTLVIAVVGCNVQKTNEIIPLFESLGWSTVFATAKELKQMTVAVDYDFILSEVSTETLVLQNERISKEIKNKSDIESFRDALIKFYLTPSIVIKIAAKTWEGSYSWGDYHMAVMLKQQLEKQGHSVLIQIYPEWDNDEGLEYDVVIVMRGNSRYVVKPQQINIMWNISHPDDVLLEEYETYDKIFIASSFWAEEIAKRVSVPVEEMLQCTDPERFKEPTEKEKSEYYQQLLFVGNSRDVYRKILKDLLPTKYNLAVYGRNWGKILPKKIIKGEHISNIELYKHYASADILLNDHWDDMRQKGFISNRIFDGLACGAFILTDKVNNMGQIENYVDVYETKEELNERITFNLNNRDKRVKKSQEGRFFVLENHTFRQRSKVFSSSIKKLLKLKIDRNGYD